jgi:hypothetical protein
MTSLRKVHQCYDTIGKHYGKKKLMKLFGLIYRDLQLTSKVMKEAGAGTIARISLSALCLSAVAHNHYDGLRACEAASVR